jgi:hypothetical protein
MATRAGTVKETTGEEESVVAEPLIEGTSREKPDGILQPDGNRSSLLLGRVLKIVLFSFKTSKCPNLSRSARHDEH